MNKPPSDVRSSPARPFPYLTAALLAGAIAGCSIWANLSFAITNPAYFRFIPPFVAHANYNRNSHLGAEYFNIGRALAAGKGYSNPFGDQTGPTAWQPPVFPFLLAGLLWAFNGNQNAVMAVVIVLQVLVLIGTGLLLLALSRQTMRHLGPGVTALAYFLGVLCHFWLCFQLTHDSWLVMLALDLLIAGLCWYRPLQSWWRAAGWGLFGGFAALISPVVGFAWGSCSLLAGWQQRRWSHLALAMLAAGVTLAPWTVRNYLVFGRLVLVKSNLAYEAYQSQCLQAEGLLLRSTFSQHSGGAHRPEGKEYRTLGEMAYMDRKRQQYWESVWADPEDFLDRVASRFLGATLWYVPFDWARDARWAWVLWLNRLLYPLPFLAALVLLAASIWKRLPRAQWVVLAVCACYLLPYIWASYYERYGLPLLGLKVLLVLWAIDWLLSLRRRASSVSVKDKIRLPLLSRAAQTA
jgi:hypothetical protein